MIEEVVNSILEAEDVAQRKIDDAKSQAGNIVGHAEAEADKFKKQASAANKQLLSDGMRRIEQQTSESAGGLLAEMNCQADKEMAQYEKNVDNAVKIILEHLI